MGPSGAPRPPAEISLRRATSRSVAASATSLSAGWEHRPLRAAARSVAHPYLVALLRSPPSQYSSLPEGEYRCAAARYSDDDLIAASEEPHRSIASAAIWVKRAAFRGYR